MIVFLEYNCIYLLPISPFHLTLIGYIEVCFQPSHLEDFPLDLPFSKEHNLWDETSMSRKGNLLILIFWYTYFKSLNKKIKGRNSPYVLLFFIYFISLFFFIPEPSPKLFCLVCQKDQKYLFIVTFSFIFFLHFYFKKIIPIKKWYRHSQKFSHFWIHKRNHPFVKDLCIVINFFP